MGWLSDRLEEAKAQLNPFDNGRTAQTVRKTRYNTPATTKKLTDSERAKNSRIVAEQQRQNLLNVTRQAYQTGNQAQRQAATNVLNNKSWAAQNSTPKVNNPIQPLANFADGFTVGARQMGTGLAQGWGPDARAAQRAREINQRLVEDFKLQSAKRFAANPTQANQRLANSAQNEWAKQLQRSQIEQGKRISDLDPIKNAAAIADVAFNVATVGMGGLGANIGKQTLKQVAQTGTKQQAAKAAAKLAGNTLPRRMVAGSLLAAPSGALDPVIRQGKDATAKDMLTGAAVAGTVGAAFPAVMGGVGKAAQNNVMGAEVKLPSTNLVKPSVKATTKLVKSIPDIGKPTGQALARIERASANLSTKRNQLVSTLSEATRQYQAGKTHLKGTVKSLANDIKKIDDELYSLEQLKTRRFNQKGAINPDEPSVIKNNQDLADTAKAKKAPVEKTPTLQDALEGKNTKINGGVQSTSQLPKQTPKSRQSLGSLAKGQGDTAQGQPTRVRQLTEQSPANQPSSRIKASSYTDNTPSKLDKQAYKETFGVSDAQATKDLADIEKGTDMTKVIGNQPTKEQAKLLKGIEADDRITKAAKEAQRTGKEFNFYGKTDKNGRSVGIETFNPKTHRIEAGFVVDQDGNLLGNHIKIDETGTAINIGGRYTKMEDVFGDITKWKSQNKYTSTPERNLMEAAPDEETGRKAYKWLVASKTKAEREWKEAISQSYAKNDARQKSVMKNKPSGVSKKEVLSDAMDYGEAKLSKTDLTAKYGKDYTKTVTNAIDGMRADYDKYIKDINATRTRFGLEPIEPRKDYITHISELNNNKNFVGDLTTALKNSITGEAMERTRGGVPADIAGRTEGFAPSTKWNQYLQRRKGGKYEKDPFKAFNEYVPNAEHNIHMTESVVRARSAEEFLRARANLAELDSKNYGKLLSDELGQKVKGGPQDDKLVSLFQEYANALAGKTQKLDRSILDSPLRPGLKGWQSLQRVGGRATILGNVSSVLMQPLNQVNVFASVKPRSYAKGMAKWLSGDKVIDQSNFVQARIKHIDSALRGKGQKFQDAAGVPLRTVEEQSVKLAWYSNYEDVLRKGLKGKDAVIEADRLTERTVAGRGLADKPEAYRSTAINGFLQYTLEVMAQAKVFWKDLTPVQKAKWIAGAAAINTGYEMVMNDRPLPDYLNAVVEGTGVMNAEDDRNAGEKIIDTAQGLASETAKFNPIVSNTAQYLPKDLKMALFGTESDLTRFDGNAAPIRVLQNAYKAGEAAIKGNAQEAISRGLRLVPTGNQIQKTGNSVVMNARGYNVDKNGKPTFDAPTTAADIARSLLFGPYATDASQEYYSSQKTTKTKEAEKTAANKGTLTLDQAQANATKRIETAFGRDYANLGVKELKELAKTDPTAKQAYDIWNQTTKAFGAGADTPVGLNPVAEKILNRASRTTNKEWDNMKSSVGEVQTELQKWLPEGYNLPKVNNYTAKAWADYEKKLADGTLNEISADKARRDIIRAAYKSDLDDITRSFYSLGDDAMRTQLQKGTITKAQMDKVIEIDNVLTALGIQSYAQVGKTLRRELGYAATGGSKGSSRSGRSSGGRKTKSLGMDYKLFGFGDPKNAGGQSLRKLLEKYIV